MQIFLIVLTSWFALSAFVALGWIVWRQAGAIDVLMRDRDSRLFNDPARQEAYDAATGEEYAMCGGCGKNVRLQADRFTLEPHDCDYDPENSRDTLRA